MKIRHRMADFHGNCVLCSRDVLVVIPSTPGGIHLLCLAAGLDYNIVHQNLCFQ